jgi:hypothetical protein
MSFPSGDQAARPWRYVSVIVDESTGLSHEEKAKRTATIITRYEDFGNLISNPDL